MGKKNKPALTNRQVQQYRAILAGDASHWFWIHPIAGNGMWSYRSMNNTPAMANAWQALIFARQFIGRDIDLKALQRIVLRAEDGDCAYEWARDIPGANIRKLQDVVARSLHPRAIEAFAKNIPGADKEWLANTLIVAEVYSS